jgi:hypothetical protein
MDTDDKEQSLLQQALLLIVDYDANLGKLTNIIKWMKNPEQYAEETEIKRKELFDRFKEITGKRHEQ